MNQIVSCHLGGLLQAEDMAERGSYIGENTILQLGIEVLAADIYERHGVERVRRVRRAVCVEQKRSVLIGHEKFIKIKENDTWTITKY